MTLPDLRNAENACRQLIAVADSQHIASCTAATSVSDAFRVLQIQTSRPERQDDTRYTICSPTESVNPVLDNWCSNFAKSEIKWDEKMTSLSK